MIDLRHNYLNLFFYNTDHGGQDYIHQTLELITTYVPYLSN